MLCCAQSDVDPSQNMQRRIIDPEHAKWRVGPGGIELKDLHLAALELVAPGTWQPRLLYQP